MMYFGLDDLRQSYVVAGNEIKKFIRSKRFALYFIIILFIFVLITAMALVFRQEGLGNTPGEVLANYVGYVFLLVIVAATLFASVVIVSEFEERTALILFTKPIKRTSIFIGKVVGCLVLESIMIIILYIALVIVSLAIGGGGGELPSELPTSFGLALLYMFAASSVAVFISATMKKSSTCAILTFVFLFIILMIISGMIGDDSWYMLDVAANSISMVIPEFLADLNKFFLLAGNAGIDVSDLLFKSSDVFTSAMVMIGWGAVSLILAWIAFIKREF